MDKAHIDGQTILNMSETIKMESNLEKEPTIFLIKDIILGFGRMVSKMAFLNSTINRTMCFIKINF